MTGLTRVHEEGGRAGACQCGGDLAGDMAGLAHASDNHAAPAFQHQAAGLEKRGLADFPGQTVNGGGLGIDNGEREILQFLVDHGDAVS